MTRLGLIGLHDLAPHLEQAGVEVISDPDLRTAVQALNAAAKEHGKIPTLLLNSSRVANLIPRIYRHLHLTVLGTAEAPCAEAEGYATYQLPGNVRDILKNSRIEFDVDAFPDDLELDSHGRLLDPDRDWSDWEPVQEDTAEPQESPDDRGAPARRTDPDADVFGAAAAVRQALRGGGSRAGLGQVVLTLSGSGGVGKSTFSLALAGRASDRGKRVVLIDGNLGQGDLGTFLRVAGAGLPTMFDAVLDAKLRTGLITPQQLNEVRNARMRPVNFAFLQAPSDIELRTGRVTPAALAELIEEARRLADLVVVDTQIVETDDPRRMVADVILPQLGGGGWAVAVAGLTSAGMANLIRVMTEFGDQGIEPSHVLSVLSRIPPEVDFDHDRTIRAFRELSVPVGTAWSDNEILMAMNRGEMVSDHPVLANLLDSVLHRVLDLPVVAAAYDPEAEEGRARVRPWSRWFGRAAKRGA